VNNRRKSKIIVDRNQLYRLLGTTATEVTNLIFATDEVA
jgi:hypothetical protein